MSKFNLGAFVLKGLLLAVGNKPEYEIRLAAADWVSKGVLTESDLAVIETELKESSPEMGA